MCSSSVVALILLFFINLINYMDRFTVAGVLDEVQTYYNLNNKLAGLLQTCFIISYMIFAPIFGFLGDRYTRKYLMCAGVLFWSLTTFLGSIIPSQYPALFFLMRALVGIGEASYSTISPTLIADLFSKEVRSRCLGIFFFAIPVGSGAGYIVGSTMFKVTGRWQWALRVTPFLGVVAVILTLIFLKEPQRGHSDGVTRKVESDLKLDIIYLSTNTMNLKKAQGKGNVNFIFGVITCIGGIAGVVLGVSASTWYKKRNPRADAIICAFGVLIAVPFSFAGIVVAQSIPILTWILVFIAVTLLCVNWSLVADMLLYVVVPHRRSFAQSIQILCSHLFGDAMSPYIVGV
ncbi:Protein spinster-like protein, partial [Dinothrombium tinctorium]